MLSTVKYISCNRNNQFWDLGNDIGLGFEDYIYKVIVKVLNATFSEEISVHQTNSVRDGGRDIIIESSKSFELFDINFSLKGKKKITIYVECKSTNQDTVSYEKFAKNAIIAGQDHADYLILVTNKTISPYSYYSACQNGSNSGYEFLLVDQYILYSYLEKHQLNKWKYDAIVMDNSQINLSYQICKSSYNQKPCFELFLMCRNYDENIAECELNLMTDWNWKMSLDKQFFLLEKNKGNCIKIKIFKEFADGLDDIVLQLSLNNHLNVIELKGTSLSYNFELPLTGENHRRIIEEIKSKFGASFFWINLYGEAGVGKTRIVDELTKFFNDKSIRKISNICSRHQKTSTFDSILNTTCKILKTELATKTLQDMIFDIEDKLLWTVLIIEDIHNADKDFLKMLSELSKSCIKELPVLLITTGRDDYTVYNEDYFLLLEKLESSKCNTGILNYRIKPFKNEECINLIRRTITDIPNAALEKIHKMSKNNPFYLVQFIEYLLEIRIINLLNRNTVGIPNILTFSEKLYIPEAIEELLEKRLQILKQFQLGIKYQYFLKSAALYGIQFPKQLLLQYFMEKEYEQLEILFRGHFIVNEDYETLRFDHESIYLFFKQLALKKSEQKQIYQILYSNAELFSLYDKLKQGVILCNIKKYAEAKECFKEPIREIMEMDNVSSENISDKYYEYYDYIYLIYKHEGNQSFLKNIILAKIYVAMHNLSMGQASQSFEDAFHMISNDHKDDTELILEVKQLQASFYLHVGMISKARGIMNDLLAIERYDSTKFVDQIKYNLFERASSLYIHSNHMQPAIEYNRLSFDLAAQMDNYKLMALSKINEAKLYFFTNPEKAYDFMLTAQKYLSDAMVPRINCHNELGILTAKIIMNRLSTEDIAKYVYEAHKLLELSIEINYPLDIIRSHFLLAILYFLTPEKTLERSKKHLEHGVDVSIRYGILKLMGNLYNLKALISIYEKQSIDYIASVFDTMIEYLAKEDLLFLGNLDFSYSNIILLTNYMIFLNEYGLESKKYQFLSQITYYGYSPACDWQCSKHINCKYTCFKNTEIFQENFKHVEEGSLLFVNPRYKFPFIFDKYFYPIYL